MHCYAVFTASGRHRITRENIVCKILYIKPNFVRVLIPFLDLFFFIPQKIYSQTCQASMLFATHRENSLFCNNKLFCSFYKLSRDQLETYQNWSLCFRVPRCAQNKLKCGSYMVVSLAQLQENSSQWRQWPHSLSTACIRNNSLIS